MAVIANLKQSTDVMEATGGRDRRVGSPMIEIALKKSATRRLPRSRRWQMLVCLEGSLWVTQAGDPRDYVLKPGEVFIVDRPTSVVVEALAAARFYVSEMHQGEPFQGRLPHFS